MPTAHPVHNVIFDANGGTVDVFQIQTDINGYIMWLPVPTRADHAFAGWHTQIDGGHLITWSTVFTADTIVYAHWIQQTSAFTVNPVYHAFPNAQPGYGTNAMEQTFVITNVGTGNITGLSAVFLDNGGTFFRITAPLQSASLNPGGSVRLGIRPAANLAASTVPYAATLLITGNNGGISMIVPLSFVVEPAPQSVRYGDLNDDGRVDSADLILMMRYFAQPNVSINMAAADVNGDGVVNQADLIHFTRFFARPGVVLGP